MSYSSTSDLVDRLIANARAGDEAARYQLRSIRLLIMCFLSRGSL